MTQGHRAATFRPRILSLRDTRERLGMARRAIASISRRKYNGRMAITRHCWKCGREYTLAGTPGRSESCICGADLKVCLNCASYDPRAAHQCRDRRAEPVDEKQIANYCEYFEMVRREYKPQERYAGDTSRESKARDALKKLFGD